MIEHRHSRENTQECLGWTGWRAEWIALACFTRLGNLQPSTLSLLSPDKRLTGRPIRVGLYLTRFNRR